MLFIHAHWIFWWQVSASYALPHNNQTGKWLTKFQASWDPKSKSLFAIGSLQKHPHGVSLNMPLEYVHIEFDLCQCVVFVERSL